MLFFMNTQISESKTFIQRPIAQKEETKMHVQDTTLVDFYSWMRDEKWPKVESQKILEHLNKENLFTDQYLSKYSAQRDEILEELKGRIIQTYQTPYTKNKEYYYYTRFIEGQEHGIFCRKHGSEEGEEEIVLDVNQIAQGKNFIRIGTVSVSPDNRYFAYSLDCEGDEYYAIRVMDMHNKGILLEDNIDAVSAEIVWHGELHGFFYVKLNHRRIPDKVLFHEIGKDGLEDRLVYQELDSKFSVSISKSSSSQYIFVLINGCNSSEFLFLESCSKSMIPKLVLPRKEGIVYDVEHHKEFFYLRINDCTHNFRLARLPLSQAGSNFNLLKYIEDDQSLYLSSFDVSKNYLILNYKNRGVPLIRVIDLYHTKSNLFARAFRYAAHALTRTKVSHFYSHDVKFPDLAYSGSAFCSNFDDDDIRIQYSSLSRPGVVFRYNFEKDDLIVLKKDELPQGFDSSKYCIQRIEADNQGVKIPITVFFHKDYEINSERPLYITGYGSYGIGISPGFSSAAISLANRGFVFAIAHIRGGDELGYQWYESGKFLHKKNTFEDFIVCTEHLIKLGYGKAGNVCIRGGSAGGMLVGAVINQRPDLYKCAVAQVPFVDVLYTMLDSSLPLTTGEYEEWGNPNLKQYFEYIRSYCPYQNVKIASYPNILATVGLSDIRVGYWEAAKWIAKIREFNTSDSNVMLKTDMSSGHGGASGRFKSLEELADILIFIFSTMGKDFEKA
jgi:oligopeptidase B